MPSHFGLHYIYENAILIYIKLGGLSMKTLIDIDEKLLNRAVRISGFTTKKETVKIAIEEFIKLKLRQRLKDMEGSDILDLSLSSLKAVRTLRLKKQALQRRSL